jgi:uncharacterized protein YbjT (DUF2867 family)
LYAGAVTVISWRTTGAFACAAGDAAAAPAGTKAVSTHATARIAGTTSGGTQPAPVFCCRFATREPPLFRVRTLFRVRNLFRVRADANTSARRTEIRWPIFSTGEPTGARPVSARPRAVTWTGTLPEGVTMRIAVAGATGRIGTLTVAALERAGHEPVPISRAVGADAYTGAGLDAALRGADAVIDTMNNPTQNETEVVDFFGTTTANLLAAEQRAGVRHHVLLSIVGVDHGQKVPHYAGKREQERLVTHGSVPWTIVRATQFHDFAATVAGWTARDGVATIAPLLVQPIAQADVAAELAEVAVGEPLRAAIDIAGPQTQDLVDMARRTLAVRGQEITLVPTWRGVFGLDMAGEVLLPGEGARLTPTSFEDWLAAGAR